VPKQRSKSNEMQSKRKCTTLKKRHEAEAFRCALIYMHFVTEEYRPMPQYRAMARKDTKSLRALRFPSYWP